MIRTYSELIKIPTFKGRVEYLSVKNSVGSETFGYERYLNQRFYNSREWKRIRDYVITRDLGCDLGFIGYEIFGEIVIHHMNSIEVDDIREATDFLLNPEYLITTCHHTHNAIHYGDELTRNIGLIDRKPNDTCPWKF